MSDLSCGCARAREENLGEVGREINRGEKSDTNPDGVTMKRWHRDENRRNRVGNEKRNSGPEDTAMWELWNGRGKRGVIVDPEIMLSWMTNEGALR